MTAIDALDALAAYAARVSGPIGEGRAAIAAVRRLVMRLEDLTKQDGNFDVMEIIDSSGTFRALEFRDDLQNAYNEVQDFRP